MTNAANELNEGIDAAIAALAAAGDAEATNAAPKAKGRKPKATKAKTAAEVKAEAAEPKASATLDGFELSDGADAEAIRKATAEAAEAIDAINRKDADLLASYLSLGAFNSQAAKAFKSTKIMGQYIAKHVPASQALDAALRSNCKWLWEALNDPEHEAFDRLLTTLGVNRIEDFKSGNPTVIRREYSALIKAEDAKAKAEALGIEADDPVKAISDAEKAEKAERFAEELALALEKFAEKLTAGSFTKADIAFSVSALLREVVPAKPEKALEALNTFKPAKAPKADAAE